MTAVSMVSHMILLLPLQRAPMQLLMVLAVSMMTLLLGLSITTYVAM
jgi:hypothetical protein